MEQPSYFFDIEIAVVQKQWNGSREVHHKAKFSQSSFIPERVRWRFIVSLLIKEEKQTIIKAYVGLEISVRLNWRIVPALSATGGILRPGRDDCHAQECPG